MKKSFLFIAITLLTGILSVIAADKLLQKGFHSTNEDVIGKLNELMADTSYYQVLCLGSSRCLSHIDPFLIQQITGLSTYNGGLNGGTLIDYNIVLDAYLQKRKPPEVLILHIDFMTLEKQNISELPRYFPFISNPGVYNGLVDYEPSVYYVNHFPPLRVMYYYDLLKWIGIKSLAGIGARNEWQMDRGFVRKKVNPNGNWNSYQEAGLSEYLRAINRPLESSQKVEKCIQLFSQFLKTCEKFNIQLVLTSSPVIGGDKSPLYDETVRLMAEEAEPYKPLKFWMHRKDMDRRQYYFDHTHMNYQGAEYYTRELANFIEAEYVQAKRR